MNAPMLATTSTSGAPCGCGSAVPATSSCACGGAGCDQCAGQGYVRPRFFAGQLLTEDDLQALGDYVANKNRLHNRYLMGSGVVCGFEVTCHPCGNGRVIVHPGYALDCCGNDIVLQCATELDINGMVRDLRRNLLGGYDCGDPCADKKQVIGGKKADTGSAGGKGEQQKKPEQPSRHYCLYVRYCEELTDPVTPYASDEPCGQATCEPTRVREGLRFELRCEAKEKVPNDFIHRLIGCIGDLAGGEKLADAVAQIQGNPTADSLAYVKEALLDQLDSSPDLTDCALRNYVASIALPAADATDPVAASKLVEAFVRYLRDCFCAAINPPCAPCEDPGVLLACLEVQDCEVVDICNLERMFVLTAPAFRYWVPIYLLGEALERACCSEIHVQPSVPPGKDPGGTPAPTPPPEKPLEKTIAMNAATPPKPGTGTAAPPASKQADTVELLLGNLGMSALQTVRLSLQDAMRLSGVLKALGTVTAHGAFDSIFPASRLLQEVRPRVWAGEVAAEQIRKDAAIRESVNAVVADRMNKSLQEIKAGSEQQIAAEVNKQVNAALPADKLDAVTAHARELKSLKDGYAKLDRKYAELAAKFDKPKGPPK